MTTPAWLIPVLRATARLFCRYASTHREQAPEDTHLEKRIRAEQMALDLGLTLIPNQPPRRRRSELDIP